MGRVGGTAPQVLRVLVVIVAVGLTSLLALGVASAGETAIKATGTAGSGDLTGYGGTTGSGGGPPSSPSSPSSPTGAAVAPATETAGLKTSPGVVAAAHIASPVVACVARSTYVAAVSGSGIASATFILDRHKVTTVKHSPFSARIKVQAGRTHHLAIRVAFVPATGAAARTLHQTLARCASGGSRVGARTEPRFTG